MSNVQGAMSNSRPMKDSGVEWIGEIPKAWNCFPFKAIIKQNDGGIWGDDPIGDEGEFVLRSTEQTVDGKWSIVNPAKRNLNSIDGREYYRCKKDDLLITKSSGSDLHIGKTTIVNDSVEGMPCYYSNFMQRIRLHEKVLPRFYWYILNSNIARAQFTFMQNSTSGIGNINAGYIDNLKVPIPPNSEQRRIADFLDRRCAEIDGVIEATKKTIEEYKALKQAVITEAVTGKCAIGNVQCAMGNGRPMKDSGIEWIGEIPEEWEVIPIKYLASYNDEVIAENTDPNFEFDYIEIGSVEFGKGIIEMQHLFFRNAPSRARRIVQANDVIVSTVRTYLKAVAAVPEWKTPLIASTGFVVIRPKAVIPAFLKYAILSDALISSIEAHSTGISYPAINASQVVQFKVPLPKSEEQLVIAEYLDEKCGEVDRLIAEKQQLLSELETYKKSVIYEYVTGKKEVSAV